MANTSPEIEAALAAIEAARIDRDAAQALLDQKTDVWKDAIRTAAELGAQKPVIMKAAKINRARVYAILGPLSEDE